MSEYRGARAALVAPAAAALAAGIAVVELARRWLEAAAVDGGGTREAVMVPATAVGVLLAAGALALVRPRTSEAARGVGRLLAAATAVLGLVVVGQYLAEWGGAAGSGVLLDGDRWTAQRPGPTTGLGLTTLGAACLALGAGRGRVRRWADAGAAATLVIALTGLIGHAYGASVLYGLNRWGGTALPTAVALSAVALGVLFADPSRGSRPWR